MSNLIVTAAFENRIEYPEENSKADKFFNALNSFDPLLYLVTSGGRTALYEHIYNQLDYDLSDDINFLNNNKYMSFARYDNEFEMNHRSIYSNIKALVDKKGNGQFKIPVITGITSRLDSLIPFFILEKNLTINGNSVGTYAFNAVHNWFKETYEPGTYRIDFDLKKYYKEAHGQFKDELSDLATDEEIKFCMSLLSHYEFDYSISKTTHTAINGEEKEVDEIQLGLYAVINVPAQALQYLSQTKDTVSSVLALQLYATTLIRDIYNDTFNPFEPIKTLDTVIEDTKDLIKEIKLTNNEDFAVSYDGTLNYIPNVSDPKIYKKYIKKAVKTNEDGTTEFNPSKASKPNMVVYTDWRLSKFNYTTTTGNMAITDLTGYMPATVKHFARTLEDNSDYMATCIRNSIVDIQKYAISTGRINSFADCFDMSDIMSLFDDNFDQSVIPEEASKDVMSFLEWLRPGTSLTIQSKTQGAVDYMVTVKNIAFAIERIYGRYNWGDNDLLKEFISAKTNLRSVLTFDIYKPLLRLMKQVNREDYEAIMKTFGVERGCRFLPVHHVLSTYTSARELDEQSAKFSYEPLITVDEDYEVQSLHNVSDELYLLPHQIKADFRLKNESPNTVLNAAAGAGKTILAITDSLRHIEKGRRVCIVCPNYLMRNYIEDVAYSTKGQLNVVCINTDVYNRYEEQGLSDMINNAPVNTVFVIGLNVFSQGKNIRYNYNGKSITINQIVEFLRSFNWDVCIIDESHKLASDTSNRSTTMARFLSSIPFRRELTGTFINNNCLDAFGQTKYLDPGIFGNKDDFLERYAAQLRGDKVISWKSNAERDIAVKLATNVDFVPILRKEWAALLPERREEFHFVELSGAQQKVYEAILKQVLDDIKKDPKMKALLEAGKEDDAIAIEAMLKTYLARIERFLASCDLDELGQALLQGKDLVSPKSTKINEILESHFKDPELKDGKVLIFVSYRNSAKSLYENLDPKFKKMALLYEAERKEELIPIMKKDKNVKIVIGVEQSLNTGHNFQMFNRLIRAEGIWNPGTLDQAESRINRPDPKNKSAKRPYIYLDWVLCDKTIDISKASRLISKVLSAARFNNSDPRYDSLPELGVVSMNLENILHNNSFEGSLSRYLDSYKNYLDIQKQEFEEFREKATHKEPMPVKSKGLLKGSQLMNVPYIPGMVLPYQDDLHIVSLEDYALESNKSVVDLSANVLKNKRVHTEHGDGTIVGASARSIRVKLDNHQTVSVDKLTAFILPKDQSRPTKDLIKEKIGIEIIKEKKIKEKEIEEVVVLDKKVKDRTIPIPLNDLEADKEVEVYLGTMNNMFSVVLNAEDEDLTPSIAQQLDLNYSGQYWYCHCRRYQHLESMLTELEKRFTIPQAQLDRLYEWLELFESGRAKLFNVERATRMEMKDFYLRRRKKVPKGELHVFPLVEDGDFYIIAFVDNQVSDAKLPRIKVRGTRWEQDDEGFYYQTFLRKSEIKDFIKSLSNEGITVTNLEDVKESYKALKVCK